MNEAILKLVENQGKIVAKIQELEKRLSGIETHILGDPSKKESLDLHQSFPVPEVPVVPIEDELTKNAEEVFGKSKAF